MDKLLSIVVPVYNAEQYVRECLDSLLSALRNGMEIILVDDGSKDKSGEICDEYAKKYQCVSVIHKKNGGVTSARLEGVRCSSAEYVTFVDNDDWINADMYEKMMGKAVSCDADVVICDMIRECENGQTLLPSYVEEGFYDRKRLEDEVFPAMLFDFESCFPKIAPSLCNKVFRREIIANVIEKVDPAVTFGEDALCTFPAILDCRSAFVMKEVFYHYRYHQASVSNTYDPELLNKILVLYDEMKRRFEERLFDDGGQLKGYLVNFSLVCIRKEVLENKSVGLKKRMNIVRGYINDSRVQEAFVTASEKNSNEKRETRLKMIRQKRVRSLFFSLMVKDKLMKLRGRKYEY